MPLPLAHTLAGAAVYEGLDAEGGLAARGRLVLALVIANLPDLDLVPGIVAGEPNRYHHVGFSHSAPAAIALAVAVGLVAAAGGRAWPTRTRLSAAAGTALMVGSLLVSHVVLDTLNRDLRAPAGPPALWPFVDGGIQTYPWFVEVAKLSGEGDVLDFVRSVLTVHNLYAMAWEFVTVAPILALAVWWRRRRDRHRPAAKPPRHQRGSHEADRP